MVVGSRHAGLLHKVVSPQFVSAKMDSDGQPAPITQVQHGTTHRVAGIWREVEG